LFADISGCTRLYEQFGEPIAPLVSKCPVTPVRI
jgi:hypothetical protein